MTIHMFVLLFMSCSTIVFSQTDISLFGGNYISGTKSTMLGTEFIQLDPIYSFSGGLIVKHHLSDQIAVRSGLNYQKRGFSFTEGTSVDVFGIDIPLGVEVRNEINYLEVPLMLEYKIPVNSSIQPYIAGGLAFAYGMNGNLTTRAQTILDFNVTNTALNLSSNDYNRVDISTQLMAGVQIPSGNSHFLVELGYGQAINDFISDDFFLDAGGKHFGWQMNVGYGIRF